MRTFSKATFFTILFLGMLPSLLVGQKGLEGLWEGTITLGGIHSTEKKTLKYELYLKKKGRRWQGKSIIYLENGETIETDIKGRFYEDRSMYFKDIAFAPKTNDQERPSFFRKYQLVYNRSIWSSELNGYWQENVFGPFEKKRRQGRIFLKKVKQPNKA